MARFLLSPAATADVGQIADSLDEHAPRATDPVLRALETAVRRLVDHPGLGHLVEEPLRFYPAWSYLVIYHVSSCVEIVRVLHAARDVSRELRSEGAPRPRQPPRPRPSVVECGDVRHRR